MSTSPTDTMATTEEALAWLDDHKNDPTAPAPIAIQRAMEHMLGIPAMYDEWANPDCTLCNGTGELAGNPCTCILNLDNAPGD